MKLLRKSTAATIVLGPFLDDTDGKTAETGLTISQGDVLLHKHDGTSIAQKNDATSATHRSSGYYTVPLDTTDTNTAGRLRVMVSESGALPVWEDFFVMLATAFDALLDASGSINANVTALENGTIIAATIETGAITSSTFATGAITAAALAADAGTEIANAVAATAVPGAFGAGTIGKLIGDNLDAPVSAAGGGGGGATGIIE